MTHDLEYAGHYFSHGWKALVKCNICGAYFHNGKLDADCQVDIWNKLKDGGHESFGVDDLTCDTIIMMQALE